MDVLETHDFVRLEGEAEDRTLASAVPHISYPLDNWNNHIDR